MNIQIGLYKHYKGNYYYVTGIGRHTETLEEFIIYRNINDSEQIWIRPKSMFQEKITYEGVTQPRFQFIRSV